MNVDLYNFVKESNRIEGLDREPTSKEIMAHEDFLLCPTITVEALVRFVRRIEPEAQLRCRRGLNVRVGDHYPIPGGVTVVRQLEKLLARKDLSAWERHTRYLNLHPFTDGNGRSGRALWLWDRLGRAPLGFLHSFYYETLQNQDRLLV